MNRPIIGNAVWVMTMFRAMAGLDPEPARAWYIHFRKKGTDPTFGGFLRVGNTRDRDQFTNLLRENDLRVEWKEVTV